MQDQIIRLNRVVVTALTVSAAIGLFLITSHAGSSNAGGISWKAQEIVNPYVIDGVNGAELYRSIGERGPQIGKSKRRVIAHTAFTLKWNWQYATQGSSCSLISARPAVTITYTLPKPSQKLTPDIQRAWDHFIQNIEIHERFHGETVKEMVNDGLKRNIGRRVENDPRCRRLKQDLYQDMKALLEVQRLQGQEFDRKEMGAGGNVERLVFALLNDSL